MAGLDELWQRRIVREVGAGSYDFSHDKLREVAYAELSLTRRALLHRHTAEALEGAGRAGVSGQIAHHYEHAGLPERAIPHFLRFVTSGKRLTYDRAALAAAEEEGEPGAVATARFRLAFALLWHDDLTEAEEQFEAALALLERTGDVVGRVRCLVYLSYLHRKRADVDAARSYARRP